MPGSDPGQLDAIQSDNDTWRGWPVLPLKQQHPIRLSRLGKLFDAGAIDLRATTCAEGASDVGL